MHPTRAPFPGSAFPTLSRNDSVPETRPQQPRIEDFMYGRGRSLTSAVRMQGLDGRVNKPPEQVQQVHLSCI